ncbi:MAG: hypothetical protein LHW56_04365 [Candidatus Cloacimonetes bacterium]|nr:hypothetical protein [Candidatus Cloacimonadota bacterium]MDY0172123.1 hypothetical protein [Candidatus Cloacimonadaceae bacterium]
MKVVFDSEEERKKLIEFQKSNPELYKKYCLEMYKVKEMEFDEFDFYLREELDKSNNSKGIKEIGTAGKYEFRIPPSAPHGVLRAEFTIEGDCYTICITRIWIKDHKPNDNTKKRKSNEEPQKKRSCKRNRHG